MGHEFENVDEVEVTATPEQVWDAIATGPGIDSWFMGRNEVVPGEVVRTAFGQYTPTHSVNVWEPGRRFRYGGDVEPDGRYIAYEFLVEGRERGSTVLRMTTQGFLPGDDWADEFEAMSQGGAMFYQTLVTYLNHFAGRFGTPLTVFGPVTPDWPAARKRLHDVLGGSATGEKVRLTDDDLGTVEGTVFFANDETVGVRTGDALYRFVRGFHGPIVAMHTEFRDIDAERTTRSWQSWLDRTFA
jgi:uncharacterized protein YndB with AHSA1/START domain